ncbi:MAG: tetratricopeptide repeat protein [Gammaproteobacteria bacterium]|nr:tetratricopeptide repeat protein [Gammaproteobacteria bacterium]
MSFFQELKRRNVFRVGAAYAVAAWVILQLLDVVGEILELPAWGAKAILLALVVGFFVALLLAWAFELTPEGIMRESEVDRSESITPQTGRKLDRFIIVALAIAVGYLLLDKFILQNRIEAPVGSPQSAQEAGQGAAPTSVAVLPFINMSGDKDNEYFSDGLTETLLHMLSQLPGLQVAARTSSFAFKEKESSITEIADTLGVAHVLEGSVQKADERVRVTAQLIRADDGFHVWSQNYTRPLEDIFAIQDEIAADVANALGSSLLGTAVLDRHVVDTTDLSAYDSYLKGLEQQAIYSYASLDAAENHFKQALARDTEFTDARLALVRNHLLKFTTGLTAEDEVRAAVDPLIGQVLDKAPDSLLARGFELTLDLMIFDGSRAADEMERKLEELQGLVQQLPSEPEIRIALAQTLAWFSRDEDKAIRVLKDGLMVDPLEPELYRALGRIYVLADRLDEARVAMERSLELAPNNPNSYSTITQLEEEADNLPAALNWTRRASEVDPQDHELAANIALDLYQLRLPEEGDYWRDRVQALAPGSAMARSLEIDRALARDEPQRAIELAAGVIADQIENRRDAFGRAVFHYVDLMLSEGRGREAYEFFLSIRPDIGNDDSLPPDLHGFILTWASTAAMSGFASHETREQAWIRLRDHLDSLGFPWAEDPADPNHTWNYLMMGQNDKAVEHYLEYELNEPLANNLDRHRQPLYAVFAPIYQDPRVAARLEGDAERYAQLRNEVQRMLQGPEWDSP